MSLPHRVGCQVVPLSLVVLCCVVLPSSGLAQGVGEDVSPATGVSTPEADSDLPIAVELAQGIDLLNEQIAQQQELLKTAQTEREQQLIRNHIRLLQKERRSLDSLLLKLVGPDFDVLEEMQERRQQQWEQKEENVRDRQE